MALPIPRGARRTEPELMDQPELDDSRLYEALKGLARINTWSRTAVPLYDAVLGLARDEGLSEVRVLDVASGGGDVPVRLWHKARRHGLRLVVHGCDRNPRAVDYARRQAAQSGADVEFFTLDTLNDPLPGGYDVLTCTLFLHHLQEDQAVDLLRKMTAATNRMIAVDDLRRSPWGTVLAGAGVRFLTRSDVVHVDALRSARAAFTIIEAAGLAMEAGLGRCTIRPHWPFRFLLTWRKG